jgi:F-type H+-transporting ATPase subunit delta
VKNLAIARRYAKALLLIGKKDGKAEVYRAELAGIAAMMASQKQLDQAVNNPLYPAEKRKQVLGAVIAKANLSATVKSFLMLLFEKGRIGLLDAINENYQKLADELKGIARASIVSAVKLSDETIEKIRAALSRRTGKQIVLQVEQDPQLIGGMVTRIGDLILDGSIRTQLSNMRESLKRGESV